MPYDPQPEHREPVLHPVQHARIETILLVALIVLIALIAFALFT